MLYTVVSFYSLLLFVIHYFSVFYFTVTCYTPQAPCYTQLDHVILCWSVLYSTALCYNIRHCVIFCCFYVTFYWFVLYSTTPCYSLMCHVIFHYSVLYRFNECQGWQRARAELWHKWCAKQGSRLVLSDKIRSYMKHICDTVCLTRFKCDMCRISHCLHGIIFCTKKIDNLEIFSQWDLITIKWEASPTNDWRICRSSVILVTEEQSLSYHLLDNGIVLFWK